MLGLYAAEGSEVPYGGPTFGNCNVALVNEYKSLLKEIVSAKFHDYEFSRESNRQKIFMVRAGGVCTRRLIMNLLNVIMSYLARPGDMTAYEKMLGLKFLSGYAEGDGSVSRAAVEAGSIVAVYTLQKEMRSERICLSQFS